MPCFPSSRAKAVEPEEEVQHKNVHRYGETNIRYVPHRLTREQWQRRHKAPTRPLPAVPYREPERPPLYQNPRSARSTSEYSANTTMELRPLQSHSRSARSTSEYSTNTTMEPRPLQTHPRSARSTSDYYLNTSTEPRSLQQLPRSARSMRSTTSDYTLGTPNKPPRHRPPKQSQPITTDVYISVPIFNETMDHSYRKKNEYIYQDKDGLDTSSLYNTGSLYRQGGSQYSSLRDVRHDAGYRQSGSHYSSMRDVHHDAGFRQPDRTYPRHKYDKRAESDHSYDTRSECSQMTTGSSYMSERFEKQAHMKQASTRGWTNIDSDEEDYR